MPLLDHFASPLGVDWPWDGFLSAWAGVITAQLNRDLLPADYHAMPLIKRGAQDVFEVQVVQRLGGPQLRAAIELVSPANKDRPATRRAFAIKCASYLQRGVSVVIVDVVTQQAANLHAELLDVLRLVQEPVWRSPTQLYALAYRSAQLGEGHELQCWQEVLTVGAPLPTMPLWLGAELCLPLALEDSYRTTRESLRMPP